MAARKFCDKCGRLQQRTTQEWEEVLGQENNSWSYDIMFEAAPPEVRDRLFKSLAGKGALGRIAKILSLVKQKNHAEDVKWAAYLLDGAGKREEAIMTCLEFMKKRPEAKGLVERCADLFFAGGSDDLVPAAPVSVREAIFKKLEQAKQFKRMLNILSAVPDQAKTDAEWAAFIEIADSLGSLEGILARLPTSVKRRRLDRLKARGFYHAIAQTLSCVGEGEWPLEYYQIWFESCIEIPGMKTDAVKSLAAVRRRKDGEKILELYHSLAVGLEEQGHPDEARDIFKHFVDENVPYKDAFSRYMRLAGGTLPPSKAKAAVASAGAETRVAAPSVSEKYELIREIGRGGMGVVYEAMNRQIKKRVALKRMKEELALNLREKERFLAEAQRVADLHHPNIVDIYDICEQDGNVYLVFELVKGETVDEMLNRGKRPAIKEALRIACDVCRALEYAHGRRIIHRDIKPSNIMLASDGFVKVMDFGIAREAHDTLSRLTHVETSGTFSYMAPEQHLGAYDAGSDIYALGATLYEMLTLEPPFRGPDFLAQKREMVFKPLRDRAPEVPEELEKIVRRCLEAERGKRFQTAAAIKEALEGL